MDLIILLFLFLNFVTSVIIMYVSLKNRNNSVEANYIDVRNCLNNLASNFTKFEMFQKDESSRNREENNKNFKEIRSELSANLKSFEDSILKRLVEMSNLDKNQFETFSIALNKAIVDTKNSIAKELKDFDNTIKESFNMFTKMQNQKYEDIDKRQAYLLKTTEERLEAVRKDIDIKLKSIQDDNNKQLEKMRVTVDEKLHKTLEERLTQSFKLVSERLELVQKGLGEMQNLAVGVGDLKKVLSNVKTKGNLGEYQLENILEQTLPPNQYIKNASIKPNSNNKVEFAIKLPSKNDNNKEILLPIDAKFPSESYHNLLDAYDVSDNVKLEDAKKELIRVIKKCAQDIRDKYINPPESTDFAIMFLPFEGLYAEVLRINGLFETLQNEYRIVITGPTTITAFLSSLQIGFRTLAIEKRTSEVWDLLRGIKKEFSTFGDLLEKTNKKLQEASNVISNASKKSRTIEKKLNKVQELPIENTQISLVDMV